MPGIETDELHQVGGSNCFANDLLQIEGGPGLAKRGLELPDIRMADGLNKPFAASPRMTIPKRR